MTRRRAHTPPSEPRFHAEVRRLAADIDARLDSSPDLSVSTELEALYRSLPRIALVTLRHAFTLDIAAGASHAFCRSRIDLIERILQESP